MDRSKNEMVEDLLDILRFNYLLYRKYNDENLTDKKIYIAGYCFALEETLEINFGITPEQINKNKEPFLGGLALPKLKNDFDLSLDFEEQKL